MSSSGKRKGARGGGGGVAGEPAEGLRMQMGKDGAWGSHGGRGVARRCEATTVPVSISRRSGDEESQPSSDWRFPFAPGGKAKMIGARPFPDRDLGVGLGGDLLREEPFQKPRIRLLRKRCSTHDRRVQDAFVEDPTRVSNTWSQFLSEGPHTRLPSPPPLQKLTRPFREPLSIKGEGTVGDEREKGVLLIITHTCLHFDSACPPLTYTRKAAYVQSRVYKTRFAFKRQRMGVGGDSVQPLPTEYRGTF